MQTPDTSGVQIGVHQKQTVRDSVVKKISNTGKDSKVEADDGFKTDADILGVPPADNAEFRVDDGGT